MGLRLRRGTDTQRQSIIPEAGEPVYVTDTQALFIGDGITQGGNPVSSTLASDTSPQLGGNLDLNTNNIIGQGNIDIDGNISITGDITIGDQATDTISLNGEITSNIIPSISNNFTLGSQNSSWLEGYFKTLNVGQTGSLNINDTVVNLENGTTFSGDLIPDDGIFNLGTSANSWLEVNAQSGIFETLTLNESVETENLIVGTIYGSDSSVFYDSDSEELTTSSVIANTLEGDLTGSVFSKDSLRLVDADQGHLLTESISIKESQIEINSPQLVLASSIGDTPRLTFQADGKRAHTLVLGSTTGVIGEAPGDAYIIARNSFSNAEVLQPGDYVGAKTILGYDGGQFIESSSLLHFIDNNASITSGNVPGKICLVTFKNGDTLNPFGVVVDSDGFTSINRGHTEKSKAELDVNGSGLFEGEVGAAAFRGTVTSDDSIILVDGVSSEIVGPVRNLEVRGPTGTPNNNTDNLSPAEWLEVTVNGNTRYIPLYS